MRRWGAGELVLAVTAEQRAVVDAALRRRDLAPRLRERLEMVKGAALGQDEAAIAAWVGRTPPAGSPRWPTRRTNNQRLL